MVALQLKLKFTLNFLVYSVKFWKKKYRYEGEALENFASSKELVFVETVLNYDSEFI